MTGIGSRLPVVLGRLKWVAIVVPLLFLALLYVLVHNTLRAIHDFPASLVLLLLTACAVGLFSFAVFASVSRVERRVLEQNRELEHLNRELGALLAVGRAASASLDLSEVLAEAVDAMLEVTSADAAEVWLMTEDGELVLAHHGGAAPEAFTERARLFLGEGVPGLAADSGESIIVRDLANEERFVRQKVKTAGFATYFALPLRHRDHTVGVLGVAARDGELSLEDELSLVEGVGERLATAIANARLHERVLDGAVLEERVRIARELHDGLAQVLGYINTQTLAVRRLLATGRVEDAQRMLGAMESSARKVYRDVRQEILGLRSATESSDGLVPSLRRYVADFGAIAGLSVELQVEGPADGVVLAPSTEIQLVRIVQEALTNVRKHARAQSASVTLTADGDRLHVHVSDDGRGFDPNASAPIGWPRFGLQTMRERADSVGGAFAVSSAPGSGTTVSVHVPLPQEVYRASAAG